MKTPEKLAAELLPCDTSHCDDQYDPGHCRHCPAYYRPAVAAAIQAERDAAAAREAKLRRQLEEVDRALGEEMGEC